MTTADNPQRLTSDALTRAPLREQIKRLLLDGLVSGRWRPGDRIVERQVAAELGVSQGPVREALRDLEAMRLIESSPNRGARVCDFTERELREVYPVRAALERLAAETAVDRLAEDLSVLEAEVTALHAAALAGDTEAQIQHAIAFHREIVRAAGNAILLRAWEGLGIELWTSMSIRWLRTELHENADDHEFLVEAFRRRDPRVGELLQEHVLSYWRGRGGGGGPADQPVAGHGRA
ncbi:GntR family transcriptional regulator [Wenjunlia vitaminophila]|uniref:GntR family transcriptional regulator n=1 Tax=Wenjunlia vitaminophila TaxID=76728 RepID=UPI0003805690|nr:GntR family transcriptional regulator [Wenjunlia vitaminophila]